MWGALFSKVLRSRIWIASSGAMIHHWTITGRFYKIAAHALAHSGEPASVLERAAVDVVHGTCLTECWPYGSQVFGMEQLFRSFLQKRLKADSCWRSWKVMNYVLEVPCLSSSLTEKAVDGLLEVDTLSILGCFENEWILPWYHHWPHLMCC